LANYFHLAQIRQLTVAPNTHEFVMSVRWWPVVRQKMTVDRIVIFCLTTGHQRTLITNSCVLGATVSCLICAR
jgi:hypothetical protein